MTDTKYEGLCNSGSAPEALPESIWILPPFSQLQAFSHIRKVLQMYSASGTALNSHRRRKTCNRSKLLLGSDAREGLNICMQLRCNKCNTSIADY